MLAALGIAESDLQPIVAREQKELERRVQRYRGDRAATALQGRTVVLVDDGVATGATAVVGARVLCARGARRIVLAVPVGPPELAERIAGAVDEIVQLEAPADFVAVGQAYEHFDQTTDEEVRALLQAAHQEREPIARSPQDPPGDLGTGKPRELVAGL